MLSVPNIFELELKTLYLTQLNLKLKFLDAAFNVLNLRRQRVHMRCQISKFTVELLNKYMVLTFLGVNSGLRTLYLRNVIQSLTPNKYNLQSFTQY